MKRITLIVAVAVAVLVVAPAADGYSLFLSKPEAREAIEDRASEQPLDEAAYYEVTGCYRMGRSVVKCSVEFSDESEEFLCGAIYRAKVYSWDPGSIYTRVMWDNCD